MFALEGLEHPIAHPRRQHPHFQKEVRVLGKPLSIPPGTVLPSSRRHDEMHMRMVAQIAPPRVQHPGHAHRPAQMPRVRRDVPQRPRTLPKEQIIADLLMRPEHAAELSRDRKRHQDIIYRQQTRLLPRLPFQRLVMPARMARPVPAARRSHPPVVALRTLVEHPTRRLRPARLQPPQRPPVARRHASPIRRAIRRRMLRDHLRQRRTPHAATSAPAHSSAPTPPASAPRSPP